jgi:2-C-methyl-D-erythritol 4-phosphate cytidylyltransferase
MEPIDVVVPSAGNGTRVGQSVPKQFRLLGGEPMIVHPLRVYRDRPWIGRLIVVHGHDQRETLTRILDEYGVTNWIPVEGGATRQESVRLGLAHVTTRRVVVHNAAVALVTAETIEQVIAVDADCVTTTTPVETNLVRGEDTAEVMVSRVGLKVINSPQCFVTDVLRGCHARAAAEGLSFGSEAELMLFFRKTVRLVPGPARNFKITTAHDLLVAEAILASDRVASK